MTLRLVRGQLWREVPSTGDWYTVEECGPGQYRYVYLEGGAMPRDLPPLSGVIIAAPIGLLMWACLALLVWALWHVPAAVWGVVGHLVVLGAGVWVTVACLVRADQR